MSVKYTQIPMNDPESNEPAFIYNSVFTYERPEFFSYGKPKSSKYQSAFTYKGSEDSSNVSQTEIGTF